MASVGAPSPSSGHSSPPKETTPACHLPNSFKLLEHTMRSFKGSDSAPEWNTSTNVKRMSIYARGTSDDDKQTVEVLHAETEAVQETSVEDKSRETQARLQRLRSRMAEDAPNLSAMLVTKSRHSSERLDNLRRRRESAAVEDAPSGTLGRLEKAMDNKECQRKREQGLGEGMVLIGGTVHKVKDILTIKKTFDDMKKNAGTLGEVTLKEAAQCANLRPGCSAFVFNNRVILVRDKDVEKARSIGITFTDLLSLYYPHHTNDEIMEIIALLPTKRLVVLKQQDKEYFDKAWSLWGGDEHFGELQPEQLSKVLKMLGFYNPEDTVARLMEQIDTAKTGTICKQEFINWWFAGDVKVKRQSPASLFSLTRAPQRQ